MFTVKIQEAAKRAGLQASFVKTEAAALEAAKNNPAVIILDLNERSLDPLQLILKLKENPETHRVSLIGFVSHVQADLKQAAQNAGCDLVVARSAFSQNLPALLKRYADA